MKQLKEENYKTVQDLVKLGAEALDLLLQDVRKEEAVEVVKWVEVRVVARDKVLLVVVEAVVCDLP
jgi:hypothetical protein